MHWPAGMVLETSWPSEHDPQPLSLQEAMQPLTRRLSPSPPLWNKTQSPKLGVSADLRAGCLTFALS